MELIENQRVVSKYSESIRSKNRYSRNQTTIELGKRVTSPKKNKSPKNQRQSPPKNQRQSPPKNPRLKVIKINNNVKRHPHVPRYSYNTNATNATNATNNRTPNNRNPNSRIPNKYNRSPTKRSEQKNSAHHRGHNIDIPTTIKTQRKSHTFAANNTIKGRHASPVYPPRYNDTYKKISSPNRVTSPRIKHWSNPPNTVHRRPDTHYRDDGGGDGGRYYDSVPVPVPVRVPSPTQYRNPRAANINYQYIPQLQNTGTNNLVETPHKPNNIRVKSPKKVKKTKRLYQKKRLYLKQERVPKPNKHSDKIPTSEKKYFNANIFAKNINQTEHFDRLSPEDIYICSLLSEDLNIIRKK